MQGPPLGAGGFGSVHPGKGVDGRDVAIKRLDGRGRLPVDRELRVTEDLIGRGFQHVIPVFDAGRDGDDAFVVMARASDDLASAIKTRRQFPESEAVTILSHIAAGLAEVGDVVHRDLKPANVLLHEGSWKIADFGLVRLADAATSTNTLKVALTPQYAAPEQWRGEHATHATDIYALGCIGYALLTGGPPFSGGDLRAQHLGQPPPHLAAEPVLRHLLSRCLEKSPASRPALAEVRAELARAARPAPARPLGALQEVAAKLASVQAANDAALAVQRADRADRARAAQAGLQVVTNLFEEFFERIKSAAPNAIQGADGRSIRLGQAAFSYKVAFLELDSTSFPRSRFPAIAGVFLQLRQERTSYPGRSSNLWLAIVDETGLGWWEASYMTSPLIPSRRPNEPFGVESATELEIADRAAGPAIDTHQYAMKLTRVEGPGREDFFLRWAERLAAAAAGNLDRPRSLPE